MEVQHVGMALGGAMGEACWEVIGYHIKTHIIFLSRDCCITTLWRSPYHLHQVCECLHFIPLLLLPRPAHRLSCHIMSPSMLSDQKQQGYSLRGAVMRGAWWRGVSNVVVEGGGGGVSDVVWRREDLSGALEIKTGVCVWVCVCMCVLYACVVVCFDVCLVCTFVVMCLYCTYV